MKRYILVVLIIFLSIFCSAQAWPEPGAVWHYDWWTLGSSGFIKMEYASDTVFQGQDCQRIDAEKYKFVMDWDIGQRILDTVYEYSYHTYTEGDSVFYWSSWDSTFQLVYDFSVQIGDSLMVSDDPAGTSNCSDTSWVQVINTGTLSINGIQRPYSQVVSVGLSPLGMDGPVVEGIGNVPQGFNSTGFLFPGGRNCDSLLIVEFGQYKFKCFESDLTALYNPSGVDCEYLLTHLSVEEHSSSKIRVYPNPFTNEFFITSRKPGAKTLQLIDMTGRIIEEYTIRHDEERLELPDLVDGIYLIRVQPLDENAPASVFRMVRSAN